MRQPAGGGEADRALLFVHCRVDAVSYTGGSLEGICMALLANGSAFDTRMANEERKASVMRIYFSPLAMVYVNRESCHISSRPVLRTPDIETMPCNSVLLQLATWCHVVSHGHIYISEVDFIGTMTLTHGRYPGSGG